MTTAAQVPALMARCLGRAAWAAAAAWTISMQQGRRGATTVRERALASRWAGCVPARAFLLKDRADSASWLLPRSNRRREQPLHAAKLAGALHCQGSFAAAPQPQYSPGIVVLALRPPASAAEMGPMGPEPGSSGAVDLPKPELSSLGDIAQVGWGAG